MYTKQQYLFKDYSQWSLTHSPNYIRNIHTLILTLLSSIEKEVSYLFSKIPQVSWKKYIQTLYTTIPLKFDSEPYSKFIQLYWENNYTLFLFIKQILKIYEKNSTVFLRCKSQLQGKTHYDEWEQSFKYIHKCTLNVSSFCRQILMICSTPPHLELPVYLTTEKGIRFDNIRHEIYIKQLKPLTTILTQWRHSIKCHTPNNTMKGRLEFIQSCIKSKHTIRTKRESPLRIHKFTSKKHCHNYRVFHKTLKISRFI